MDAIKRMQDHIRRQALWEARHAPARKVVRMSESELRAWRSACSVEKWLDKCVPPVEQHGSLMPHAAIVAEVHEVLECGHVAFRSPRRAPRDLVIAEVAFEDMWGLADKVYTTIAVDDPDHWEGWVCDGYFRSASGVTAQTPPPCFPVTYFLKWKELSEVVDEALLQNAASEVARSMRAPTGVFTEYRLWDRTKAVWPTFPAWILETSLHVTTSPGFNPKAPNPFYESA